MKKRAVVYARYSSHRQGEQSIEGQLAEAYKYAEAHNMKIVHEYIDRAMTGRNDNREAFQKMLKDSAKHQFDFVILWKIDRFGRNREEIAFNKYKFRKNDVKVVYIAESIPDSPEGVILESVLEGMAEYYSLQLSQNIKRGQRASAEKCQTIGGNRPLGYLTDPKTKKFIIDPHTAPTVKLIFNLYCQGKSIAEIMRYLNNCGLKTLRGKKFNKNSLGSILRNEKYIGVYTYKDQIRIEDGIPAIVEVDTFKRVQEMLNRNKRASHHLWKHANYILTDKLFCGKCGSKMVGDSGTSRKGTKHNYYTCTNRKRKHECDKKSVRQQWIEEIVINATMDLLGNEELINHIADAVYEYYLNQKQVDDTIEVLHNQLEDTEKAIKNIMKAIEAGIFDDNIKERLNELEIQKTDIRAELSEMELSQPIKITKEHILFFLNNFKNGDIQDTKVQSRLIEIFINSVFVYDDKVTINFNYSDDNRAVTLHETDMFNETYSLNANDMCVRLPSQMFHHFYEFKSFTK
mgnify:CR=1 FL=1